MIAKGMNEQEGAARKRDKKVIESSSGDKLQFDGQRNRSDHLQ
jgi:hypothetical protein